MQILNKCVFASASEIGALILYFTKLILGIQKNWKVLYIFLPYKNFMSKQRILPFIKNPPFSPTPPFLGKIFHPNPFCQIRGTQSPNL